MKKLALGLGVAALALSTTAMAVTPGYYLGAQAGYNKYTNFSTGDLNALTIGSVTAAATVKAKNSSGFAYGLDGGYNFNQYFGLQLDVTKYNNAKVTGTTTSTSPTVTVTDTYKFTTIDLMAMGYYPLQNFDIFGGLGYAYINEDVDAKATATGYSNQVKASKTYHHWRPKASVGVDYRFAQNWSASLSYSRIFGQKKLDSGSTKYVPDFNTVMLGVNYSF